MIECPSYIEIKHWNEWLASAVDPEIIALNVVSVSGNAAYDYLLYSDKIPRRNDGRLTDSQLRQYAHIEAGGWWVSGLDPLNNWQQMIWGRFKPDNPRIDWQKGKPVKYESPLKIANRVTYLDIPDRIWNLVARRYNIRRYDSPLTLHLQDKLHPLNFWAWVMAHPEIPIILTEGEKKAACLLSLGFVAIALPGIWNGRVGKQDFDERLHPDLMPLTQPGRKFCILFDYETKEKTRWAVFQAILRTGNAIESAGCQCEVALLPGPEKGVDDFVVERSMGESHKNKYPAVCEGVTTKNLFLDKFMVGNALVTAIVDDARELTDYRRLFHVRSRGLSHKYPPDVRVNVQYLSQSVKLPPSGLVVLSSDMGTGKTELMRSLREQSPEIRFLNNGHRVNLLKNLAERLGTEMYSDLGYTGLAKATALSITIDSLYKLNTESLTYGCIFIDEACQYLTHLLHSKTCKAHRAEILEVLEYIVHNTPLVVIADAHMDDVTVDFFRAMRLPQDVPYIIKNDWRNGDRTVYWYEGKDPSALAAQISAALMANQKIMVVSDAKRFVEKLEHSLSISVQVEQESDPDCVGFGLGEKGKDLNVSVPPTPVPKQQTPIREQTFNDTCQEIKSQPDKTSFPLPQEPPQRRLKVWSIHSGNSGSEENVAFIKDITNAVKSVDVLLASPSLGTGVDIPNYHFDVIFGVFHAISQTATECVQQLYRYRPKVPIHVWVAPRPPFGYHDTNATKIKERLLQTNEMTAFLLRIDKQTGRRGAEKDWALEAYCQIQAQRHQSINNLRSDLLELLKEMGNRIIPMGVEVDNHTRELLLEAAVALDSARFLAVTKARNITQSEYRLRLRKDYLKPEEVFECEKFRIQDAYGMEVTEKLVEMDNAGNLIRAIASLEAILAEPDDTQRDSLTGIEYPQPPLIVTDLDRKERFNLPLCMDWANYSARWLARFNLGLHHILKRLIAGGEVTATDPDLLKMAEKASQCAVHIKAILGFTVPHECKPIWLLAILVGQLGLKLKSRKQGKRGNQVNIYTLSPDKLAFAQQVMSYRQSKRHNQVALKEQQPETLAINDVVPLEDSVSTPPNNGDCIPLTEGLNTKKQLAQMRNNSWLCCFLTPWLRLSELPLILLIGVVLGAFETYLSNNIGTD